MKLGATLVILVGGVAAAAPARADTSLVEYSAAGKPRPASRLSETACDLEIELHGAVATVEIRQRITNGLETAGPTAAIYDFDLPRGAVVIGGSLRSDGDPALQSAIAVPADFPTTIVESPEVLGPDPAAIVALPAGSHAQYRAIVQPIEHQHDVTLAIRYAAIAEMRAGAMHLVVQGRSAEAKLPGCHGTVHAVAGPGATVKRIRIAGTETGARGTATFTVDARDLAIDVDLDVIGNQPVVWSQREDLGKGWAATLLTVVAPTVRATPASAQRALLVIDGSRSMELVGKRAVAKVVHAIGSALPVATEVDAIIFDRTASRVLGEFRRATPETLVALEAAVTSHVAANGSDAVAAFKLVHQAIADVRGSTMVIVISDGVIGDAHDPAHESELVHALDTKPSAVDVHAIVLDPAQTRSPGAAALRAPVNLMSGTFVEVAADDLDEALAGVDDWLRPAWLELSLGGLKIPGEVRAGAGFTRGFIGNKPLSLVLTGHGETAVKIAARPAPAAPIAQLLLAAGAQADIYTPRQPGADSTDRDREWLAAEHPVVTTERALVVLTTQGRVAQSRRAMVKGGGRYERMAVIADPEPVIASAASAPVAPSAISRPTLERLFREQLQPRSYACYQRALGLAPSLVGTVHFEFQLGRGEITQVTLVGTGNAAFDACLLDAAYQLTPPAPDFTVNADDQTIATYPLTFNVREDHPIVVLGDADSSSPLDIDALAGGVPIKGHPLKVDATTPLGNLRPGN